MAAPYKPRRAPTCQVKGRSCPRNRLHFSTWRKTHLLQNQRPTSEIFEISTSAHSSLNTICKCLVWVGPSFSMQQKPWTVARIERLELMLVLEAPCAHAMIPQDKQNCGLAPQKKGKDASGAASHVEKREPTVISSHSLALKLCWRRISTCCLACNTT